MKKSTIKRIVLVVLTTVFSFPMLAQSFQGTIEFKKQTVLDSTLYIYYIKENKVRLDELMEKTRSSAGTFLIDLDAKTTLSVSHERKVYTDWAGTAPPVMKGKCEVKKGTMVKKLHGYKCEEYIVTNVEQGFMIKYYLADDKFDFFDRFLIQLKRNDKEAIYFLQIPNVKGMFPMLSLTCDLTGREIKRLEVTKIEKKEIDKSTFEIPKNYTKF